MKLISFKHLKFVPQNLSKQEAHQNRMNREQIAAENKRNGIFNPGNFNWDIFQSKVSKVKVKALKSKVTTIPKKVKKTS